MWYSSFHKGNYLYTSSTTAYRAVLLVSLLIFLINGYACHEIVETAPHNFLKPKLSSLYDLFHPYNSPKYRNIQFAIKNLGYSYFKSLNLWILGIFA